jgi:hypothetical protein
MMMSEADAMKFAEDLSESAIESAEVAFNKVYDEAMWEEFTDQLTEEFYLALRDVNW